MSLTLARHAHIRIAYCALRIVGSACFGVTDGTRGLLDLGQCVNIIEKYGAQLAAKVHEHKQTNALTLWKNTHLLAVQRLLCHDIASVCPSDMYDVGLHMVRAPPDQIAVLACMLVRG